MGCEFLGSEWLRSRQGITKQREFCTINHLGCLVDDPPGYLNCTRRIFMLMESTHTPIQSAASPWGGRRGREVNEEM